MSQMHTWLNPLKSSPSKLAQHYLVRPVRIVCPLNKPKIVFWPRQVNELKKKTGQKRTIITKDVISCAVHCVCPSLSLTVNTHTFPIK